MAGLTDDGRLTFYDEKGARRAFRLGKIPARMAETIRCHVEHILHSKLSGEPVNSSTSRWLADLPVKLKKKLVAVGLIETQCVPELLTYAAYVGQFLESLQDVQPQTLNLLRLDCEKLAKFLAIKKVTLLKDITPGHADEFRRYLGGKKYADNTIRRTCGRAKQNSFSILIIRLSSLPVTWPNDQ